MSWEITYLPRARHEFDESFHFYENRQGGLGIDFAIAVKSMIRDIAEQPNRFPPATRVATMTRFPFNIYYRDRGNIILIVAVYHHTRDPDGWKNRR